MASTLSAATLKVTLTEACSLNGVDMGGTNTLSITGVGEVTKRIVKVPTTEQVLLNFSDKISAGTYVQGDVKYIRMTNLDDTNFLYLVFKNEYLHEFCVKLDKGQSYFYNPDLISGVIDTMLANQVPLGFTEATGDLGTGDSFIDNITANGKIIEGLRVSHDSGSLPSNSSVGALTPARSISTEYVAATTSHTTVTRHATTGAESVSEGTGVDADGTSTYSAGFGDLTSITAEADTATIDLEIFLAL